MIVVLAVVVLFAGWSIRREFELQREQAQARLQSLAELRASQVEDWLSRQMRVGDLVASSPLFAELFMRWREQGDAAAGTRLLERVVAFRRANDADSALLLDADGIVLAREHPASRDASDELHAAVREAVTRGGPAHTSIYRRDGTEMPMRIDIAVPLLLTGTPARALVVSRIDPRRALFPMLATWPVPSPSGESLLWRQVGDRIVTISDARKLPGSAGRFSEPWATSALPVARVLRNEVKPGEPMQAIDYRGVSVMATVRPVLGTDWWLVSKIDLEDVDKPAWRSARWTLAAAALALFCVGLANRLWMQRQVLAQVHRDRAEQRERLQALGLLEAIAQSSSDAIFAKDLKGRYILCNRAACEDLNRTTVEVLGRTDIELLGKEAAARLTRDDQEALAGPGPRIFEELISAPGGDRVRLSTKGPLFDAEGHLLGLFGVSRDVTETRRAERALRDSEAHYRTVVSVLNEGILVSDPQGVVLTCNPAAERIVGVPQPDWQGRSVIAPGWTLMRPDGSPMPPEDSPPGKVLAGAPAQRAVLLSTLSPAGDPIWFEVSALPVISPDTGALMAVVTSFSDVTQRKLLTDELERHRTHLGQLVAERTRELQIANESLEDAARFNRTITDTLPGRVSYWDADLRCRFANRSFLEWYGDAPERTIDHLASEIFGDEFLNSVLPRMNDALSGRSQHFEIETRRDDGSEFVHQVHYIPEAASNGSVLGIYVMAFDITALKRAEADLRHANAELETSRDEARAANQAKDLLLASMSHELRTPLNAIIGFTGTLLMKLPGPLNEEQEKQLRIVRSSGRHLLALINDLLDVAKIEAGEVDLPREPVDCRAVLGDVASTLRPQAQAKGLELTTHLPAHLAPVNTNQRALNQIILNLVGNAIKFTEYGSVQVTLLSHSEGGTRSTEIRVDDSGIGVPLEDQHKLFGAFSRVNSARVGAPEGTGLGLHLSQKLAGLLGGRIEFNSELGKGSSFSLILPEA